MNNFKEVYKHDIYANEAGIIIEEIGENEATLSVTVERRHLNGGNFAHGGLMFLLADIAMATVANTIQFPSVSIQSDIRFIAAAVEGDKLIAKAVYVYGRKKLSNCRVEIMNQSGELIAIAEGMFHTKGNFKVEK